MVVGHLSKSFLRRYLMGLPQPVRVARYHDLARVVWLKSALAEIRPEVLPETLPVPDAEPPAEPDYIQPPIAYYHQYRCLQGNPLSCSLNCQSPTNYQSPAGEGQTHCEHCSFPGWLPEQGQLIGKQGHYQIGRRLGRRGIGRLYEGLQLSSETPVTLQEYLLPDRYFNPDEQRQSQEAFIRLAGLALADGRAQDVRVVAPLEAMAEPSGERCYLVTPAVDRSPTLNRYCAQYGAVNSQTVGDILNQVLQTLTFLHQQKFTLPTGHVQTGIVHGNLTLDSLLWVAAEKASGVHGFIYLTDFALWEKLFDPALVDRGRLDSQQDLTALGKIAFWLLNGSTLDSSKQPLNPRLDHNWPDGLYEPLKLFILRLMGIEPPFESAEAARKALLQLPPEPVISQWENRDVEILPVKRAAYRRVLPILIAAIILATLGSIGWLILRSRRPSYATPALPACCLDAVEAIPIGEYVYASPVSAYWYPVFKASVDTLTGANPTLFDQVQALHPELSLVARSAASVEEAIASVQSGQAEFAIVPLTEPLPADISATIIAYDSLVPVVAFNYPERAKGLPDALDGKISASQLKEIYTGKIDNWQQLSSFDLPVKRYWSEDPTVQTIFQNRILSDAETPSPHPLTPSPPLLRPPETLQTIPMLQQILQDFENKTVGSIGVAPLSQVFGQCSVYPLALSPEAGDDFFRPNSPLIFEEGKAIEPGSDLCDRKGSYYPNANAIRNGTYPMAYPLAIVYPFDNTRSDIGNKVASLLLTQESQAYLKSVGMVSAYPL
ncbi:MAG: phosphate ABC transporter substrate-binding protein [Cyanobacteria bacterium P01_A01_bin.114]